MKNSKLGVELRGKVISVVWMEMQQESTQAGYIKVSASVPVLQYPFFEDPIDACVKSLIGVLRFWGGLFNF